MLSLCFHQEKNFSALTSYSPLNAKNCQNTYGWDKLIAWEEDEEREEREVFFSSAYSVFFAGMVSGHGERREICTKKEWH